ncbi:MAG: hypothetical protein H0W63_11295 [Gemmatimonadaceae bacterium]|nr:hypothetical protein [Gemmatimonadaceae bacterium]
MPTVTSTAKQFAQQAIERARVSADAGVGRASAAALAVGEVCRALSAWIGAEGCHALMTRARTEARPGHPSLEALQLRARTEPYIEGVAESIAQNGESATADAIQAMFIAFIDLLGRLIGVDMATNLIERSLPDSAGNKAGTEKRSAGA